MNKPTIADLPPKYQAQAWAQLGEVPHPKTVKIERVAEPKTDKKPKAKKRLRQQQGDGMNKTERAFHEYLKGTMPAAQIYPQGLTLKLANGVRYTPDFATVDVERKWTCWETKGFMRDDAAVKIKVAAARYPAMTFHLVTKLTGGEWDIEEVLP